MFDFTILGLGHLALGVTLTLDILLTKHRPVSAVLWLAVVWAFPYAGALAYLSIGVDRVRRGAASRQAAKAMVAQRAKLHPTFERHAVDYLHSEEEADAHRYPQLLSSAKRPTAPLSPTRSSKRSPPPALPFTFRPLSSGAIACPANWSTC